MKNYRRNNYIGKMKKGFKQKLSLLMIACLLFTGYRGLTISGRADSSHTEQNNEIEVSGTQVKVQLLGADLRRAATEAILKGEKVGKSNLRSYSKDQELATEFEEYFDGEKEIYNIPLNSIAENLEESLNAEEAGLQIYVERDAKDLDRLVRKESKESLLLYSKESAVAGLLPKKEEATTVSLTEEEKASDSNLERNTELTGSELITFVYENKSTERMTFQLSVDGNKYPKVTVASKTSLFKQFLSDAKKAQAEAKNAKATEAKAESTEAQTVEASKAEESSAEAKQEVAESKATEATKATEENKASEEARKDDSEVAIVSTAAEAVAESTEAKAEVKTEASEEATEARVEATEAEVKEAAAKAETAQAEKATEAQKAVVEDSSLLKDITEHSEEILPELQSIRFTQYSLNELGRKSQNVEIEGFGNVQVFYDEAAFDGDVVLEAKRLFKPEEEVEGAKLTEEQVKILKDEALYDDSASLDIRFVDKKDSAVEVEPKSPVAVRITIEKKALPEEAKAEDISIHHIVEEKGTEQPVSVETVSRSDKEKGAENSVEVKATEEKEVKVVDSEDKISKEFTVNSFSTYVVHWGGNETSGLKPIRFHYVDEAFNEIAPTEFSYENFLTNNKAQEKTIFTWSGIDGEGIIVDFNNQSLAREKKIYKEIYGYTISGVYGHNEENAWDSPYVSKASNMKVKKLTTYGVTMDWGSGDTNYVFSQGCIYHDYYFVYKPCIFPGNQEQFKEPSLINDKYITKLAEDKYELTLTGQVKRDAKKEKAVDILFIYDNTGNISREDAEATKKNIGKLMDEISALPNSYNPRYALITMDGEAGKNISGNVVEYNVNRKKEYRTYIDPKTKKQKTEEIKAPYEDRLVITEEAIQGFKIGGSVGKLRGTKNLSPNFANNDEAYNDSRQNYAFTSDKEAIKKKLNNLISAPANSTGPNYYAAIRNAKSLMKTNLDYTYYGPSVSRYGVFDNINNFDAKSKPKDNLAREDAKKIIVFITGADASRTYVKSEGVYEDYIKRGDKYYLTRAKYKKGQSIGNGKTVYYPALNDARAELNSFDNIDAFYSIGIGDKNNWSHLNELAMAQDKNDQRFARQRVLPERVKYKLYEGTSTSAINGIFSDLRTKIEDAQVENILIKDTLTNNVNLIDGDNSIRGELVKLKDNGVEVDYVLNEQQRQEQGLSHFILKQNKVGDTTDISLETPDDFVLRPGYQIRLIADVKPTEQAYKNMANLKMRHAGDPRTDLVDIYKKENISTKLDKNVYGTSVGEMGIDTNVEATISYKYKKPDDPNKYTPPTLKYNKPIIKVKENNSGYLRIKKMFKGFDESLYSKSTGEWSNLGKLVLKQINFEIYQRVNGKEHLVTTINLGNDLWLKDPEAFKNDKLYKVDGYDIIIHKFAKDKDTGYDAFEVTIDNLPMSQEYRIHENVLNKNSVLIKNDSDLMGYKFKGEPIHGKTTEDYHTINAPGMTYNFTNEYEKVDRPNNKIIVKKEVTEMGLPAFSKAEREREFDFYLALKDAQSNQLTEEQLKTIRNGFDDQLKSKISITTIQDIQKGSTKIIPVFYFKLSHNTQIEIPLEKNIQYNVIEKKEEDYDEAKIYTQKGITAKEIECEYITRNGVQFTCTGYLTEPKEITRFVNPRKIPIPTGVVRDITPYLFGIFGFVAMAGAYLTISKKRREA